MREIINDRESRARLDEAPSEHRYIDLPETFGRRFAVFVDTEEEFDWSRPVRRDQRATTAIRMLPGIHGRLRAAGVQPIYLVDHPVASDAESVSVLGGFLERGECVIGTQLHPWVNPPFEEEVSQINSFTGNLPVALQRAKLHVLTDLIEQSFGVRPTVYRAGRYGIGRDSADLLKEAGYEVDVSVRALFDYRDQGGPAFVGIRPQPYWVGDGGLLEIPLSAAYTGVLRSFGRKLFPLSGRFPILRSALARTGLLARIALTPEDMPLPQVLEAIRLLLRDGSRLLSISFHSPSVVPGHTPYVRTAEELAAFYRWWDGLFDGLAEEGVQPASMDEIVAAAQSTRSLAKARKAAIG